MMENDIGVAIKVVRTARGMSAKELADRAGLSAPYISLVETGKRKTLQYSKLNDIARALNIPVCLLVLFGESEETIDKIPGTRDLIGRILFNITREGMNGVEE